MQICLLHMSTDQTPVMNMPFVRLIRPAFFKSRIALYERRVWRYFIVLSLHKLFVHRLMPSFPSLAFRSHTLCYELECWTS